MRTISDIFRKIDEEMTGETVCIDDILVALHERGFGFLILIIAFPMALPIPVPPFINVLLASPLIILAAQQAVGRHTIWLPKWMRTKTMKRRKLSIIIQKLLPWSEKLEYFIKPRLEFVTHGIFSNFIGVFGFIMALTICVPLPMTNTIPSLGISLMAIGVIMRDGLSVIAGALIGLFWVWFLIMVFIFLGTDGMDIIKEFIKGYF